MKDPFKEMYELCEYAHYQSTEERQQHPTVQSLYYALEGKPKMQKIFIERVEARLRKAAR